MTRQTQLCLCLAALVLSVPLSAQVPPQKNIPFEEFQHANLKGEDSFQDVRALPQELNNGTRARLEAMGLENAGAFLDMRTGRFATLLPTKPLLPGPGVGNKLTWNDLAWDGSDRSEAAWGAFRDYLRANANALKMDVDELTSRPKVTVYNDNMIHIHAQRQIDGINVRQSYLKGTIGHGNLTILGAWRWADRGGASADDFVIEQAAAEAIADQAVGGRTAGKTTRTFLTMWNDRNTNGTSGYRYVAAYSVMREVPGDAGRFEILIDGKSGEIYSIQDTNSYAQIQGGVLPVTNDDVNPDGVEQAGWPMPFANFDGGTTTTGGTFLNPNAVTTDFEGPYVNINDNCGSSSLTGAGIIDWGEAAGTDCTTPGIGGAGNTRSSRTGFYELNKMIEMGRGQLPGNNWLTQNLISNMNINASCNAFWNGTVNFYRSGGGCANTGEIAGVFDHEWGHGMDANDATPGIASPSGEGIADIYTALRLNSSCIGRNFTNNVCSGFGDPCTSCTGVRDIDYLLRQSGNPHDYTWSNANCSGIVHCTGSVYAEAVWSLWKRELTGTYSYDNNTAHEIVNRLTFIGAGNTGTWFSGGPPTGGCAATSGYMNYISADDDNGDLNDGTPHMQAIFKAFDDQEIACDTPTVQDSGRGGIPGSAVTVNTSVGNGLIDLSWNNLEGGANYAVFRTEGVFQCDFGKVKLGETTNTSWQDTGLQNGRDYSYIVIPLGAADSQIGPASNCATAAPVGAPDFALSCSPVSSLVEQGGTVDLTCTVFSQFAYSGDVDLACSGDPADISCGFSSTTVSVPEDGTVDTTLTLTVANGAEVASHTFDVQADDGQEILRSSSVTVQIIPVGQNGPQDAIYDAGLSTAQCLTAGTSCASGDLFDGRATLGPEQNHPNTLDGCVDGTSGTYHNDESLDALEVRTLDFYDMAAGATVEIAATVWAWSDGSSDTADFYYAEDANNPVWTYIGSVSPPSGGQHVLTQQYTLPDSPLQAVRVNFRFSSSQDPCASGSYNDRDDLVFTVAPNMLFGDSFESGDLTGWSSSNPP